MKQTEGDRAAFEKWFNDNYYTIDPIAKKTIAAAWQASRLATVREIAEWLRQESRESGSIRLDNKADDLLAREAQSRERC